MNSTCQTGQAVDDPIRLEALAETELLDTLSEESFDRFTRVARKVLRADVSLLSLVDMERQYFKVRPDCPLPTPLTARRRCRTPSASLSWRLVSR